ncbi:hypothetical protein ABGF48_00080 [Helcococcus bovis]|uniref:hypothetical protein n=1 Tax=Helcococcus bovis TaxID=3153252 RepID=UPI0038BDF0A6
MSKLYHIKESIKKTLKKIPLFYSLGHKIMLNKEEEKKEKLRESFKKYGVQGIKDVQKLMETSGWEFFFSCGTLLGIIRENGVIEHDVDLDLAIMENENFSWEKLDELMSTINFIPFRSFYLRDEVVEKTYIREGLQIDIYVEEIIDENYMEAPFFYRRNHINYVDRMEHSVAFMRDKRTKNILRKKIFDFYVNIPENYEDILYGNYGENWRIPIKNNEIWTAPNLIFDKNIKGYKVMH